MAWRKIKQVENHKPTVSVIIPTFNEAKNLPLVLPYIPMDVVDEVIVVDGRSTDYTIDVAMQLMPNIRVVKETKPGKGAAMRRGYREAKGDILIVLDADGSNDPREIPRFVQALMEGADFAKGSRFAPSGGTTDMPRLRKFGNWGFVVLTNILFSQNFTDLCYGLHAFWRHSLDHLEVENVDGFEIDTSIYLQAVRKKLKVVDVPSFEGFRFYGVGKLQTFPDGWRVLKTIFREWVNSIQQPAPEPQVGFRSYGVNPALQDQNMVPVTGANSSRWSATRRQNGNSHAMSTNASMSDLFQIHIEKASRREVKALLPQALMFAIENLGASSGSLILFDHEMKMTHGYSAFGRTIQAIQPQDIWESREQGILGWVIQNRQPVVIASTKNDPRWHRRSWEDQEDVSRSALVVPFFVEERVVGVMILTRPEERPFMEEDLERLKGVPVKV
jgi:hypothetical protein